MKRTLVAVTAVLAGLAIMLTGCPTTTDPNNGKENGNGNGTETPTPGLPRSQEPQTINLFNSESSATVELIGELTSAEWTKVTGQIESMTNGMWEAPIPQVIFDLFARGITFVMTQEPEGNFNWKTNGDGQTLWLNLNLSEGELRDAMNNGITAVFQNRNAIDGIDVTAMAPNIVQTDEPKVARLSERGAECQSPKSHSVGAHLGTPPVAYPPSFMRLSWSRDPSAQGDRHFFTTIGI